MGAICREVSHQWDDSEVLITHEGLMLMAPSGLDPLGTLLQLIPEGEHSFRIQGENGYSAIGELAVFDIRPNGSVVSMKIGENYTYPQSNRYQDADDQRRGQQVDETGDLQSHRG